MPWNPLSSFLVLPSSLPLPHSVTPPHSTYSHVHSTHHLTPVPRYLVSADGGLTAKPDVQLPATLLVTWLCCLAVPEHATTLWDFQQNPSTSAWMMPADNVVCFGLFACKFVVRKMYLEKLYLCKGMYTLYNIIEFHKGSKLFLYTKESLSQKD